MQLSLQKRVTALEERRERLDQQGIMLRAAYDKTLEVDGLKTSFLHYMTKQMSGPTEQIDHCVTTLCNNYNAIEQKELEKQVETIARKGQTLLELLNHMTHFTKADYQTK
jgi:methyl-accepting chemotaxis protein